MHRWARLFLLMLCPLLIAAASPSEKELRQLQSQIKTQQQNHQMLKQKAQSMETEIARVQKQLVRAGADVQDFEEVLSKLEASYAQLKKEYDAVKKQLHISEVQTIELTRGMLKKALFPPELMLMTNSTIVDYVRSSLLLKETQVPLVAKKKSLYESLNKIASLQAAIKAQAAQIKVSTQRLETQQKNMEKLMQQKQVLRAHFETESLSAKKKAQELGRKAKDLQDLLSRLADERKKEQVKESIAATKPMPSEVSGHIADYKGQLRLPARGTLIQKYGAKTEGGARSKGIVLQPRLGAQIVEPFDGVVLFAGPFKSYGNVLIVEHGDNFLSVLAGMETIDVVVGQNLLMGEPVGTMSSTSLQKLYIELRNKGQPIDPTDWFIM
ncbi:MAG: peptidoglycan DD-metalloendopeptidase family protein [Alphaproteobacteria bacterium]|nr:peptidoglycan DD-metalloendopeptidase family protein [Alphaproteobacteria bacterium]